MASAGTAAPARWGRTTKRRRSGRLWTVIQVAEKLAAALRCSLGPHAAGQALRRWLRSASVRSHCRCRCRKEVPSDVRLVGNERLFRCLPLQRTGNQRSTRRRSTKTKTQRRRTTKRQGPLPADTPEPCRGEAPQSFGVPACHRQLQLKLLAGVCKVLGSPCELARRLKAACTMWTAVNRHCHADQLGHLRRTGRYAKALPRGVIGQSTLLLFFSQNSLPNEACFWTFRVANASGSEGMHGAV